MRLKAFLGLTLFSCLGFAASRFLSIDPGPIAPVSGFLMIALGCWIVFADLHSLYGKSGLAAGLFIVAFGALSEVCGLYTGLPFGVYEYTRAWWPVVDLPGGKHFPVLLPFAWLMIVGSCWVLLVHSFQKTSPLEGEVGELSEPDEGARPQVAEQASGADAPPPLPSSAAPHRPSPSRGEGIAAGNEKIRSAGGEAMSEANSGEEGSPQGRRSTTIAQAALLATATDYLMEYPVVAILGYWKWTGFESKPWLGAPPLNFLGWFLVSSLALIPLSRMNSQNPKELESPRMLALYILFMIWIAVIGSLSR